MKYTVFLSPEAKDDILKLKQSGDKTALKKLNQLIDELKEHPEIGTGKPEKLKHNLLGYWSRRITKKHRLVYEINADVVRVVVVNAFGHYGDK